MQLNARVDQRQSPGLSPQLHHAVRLLQMSALDFATSLRETLQCNPFLETEDGSQEAGADPAALDSVLPTEDPLGAAGFDRADGEGQDTQPYNERDLWSADAGLASRQAPDGETSAVNLMVAETSLTMHLHSQLNTEQMGESQACLARVVIESLDDDGYLRTPLDELLDWIRQDHWVEMQDLENALSTVQGLDPSGVAARSVAECLQLQLRQGACTQNLGLAQTVVASHLNDLAAHDLTGLARKLGQPLSRVQSVCEHIRRLDPRPGWRFGSSRTAYVVPDVIVKKHRDTWHVQLNAAAVPRVRLNQAYADLFQRHKAADSAAMGAQLQEARWTLRNVEQRFSTILQVAQAIVKRQRLFLEIGPMAMKPLGLREIAEEVGCHESTVSRVTNNKYLSTPRGVFELKHFFSRVMVSASGRECSATAIRGLIEDIIAAEVCTQPWSDAEITRQLASQGLVVARRTVTKYRQMLRIEAVGRRRRDALVD